MAMTQSRPTFRTAGKYALCQLPGVLLAGGVLFALVSWSGFPEWLAWLLLALWVLKDMALFPLVWSSYSAEPISMPMVGKVGEVRDVLDPSGYVRIGEEYWKAEIAPGSGPFRPGDRVRVREQRGLTLVVESVGRGESGR
jgi:membrane protein implicated in regulation of membrane protease activity